MKVIIFSIFALVFLFALNAGDVFACTCSLPKGNKSDEQQVKESYKNSSIVFSGEVVEVIKNPNSFFVTVRFEVEKTWDNKEFQKEITVSTGQEGGGSCGYAFEVGKRYLVYAYGQKNDLKTNICSRTASFELNKDIAVLNKIKKPKIKVSPK